MKRSRGRNGTSPRKFNQPRPRKYRPTKAEQGLYLVRHIGEPLPEALSVAETAAADLAAMKWGASAHLPAYIFQEGVTGLAKRNLRRADLRPRAS
jgi:hypothetical protein